MSGIFELLDSLDGTETPGGCSTCGAVQRMEKQTRGLYALVIAHDDECPTWQAIAAERGR